MSVDPGDRIATYPVMHNETSRHSIYDVYRC